MAERRMFAKTIIDSDAFLDMPLSSQSLYFHLSMRADDDGFINNVKKIQRMIGCNDDDIKVLLGKKFIIPFDSGVCVIKHWKIHNLIQKDRYKPTVYEDEKRELSIKNNNVYTLDTRCIHDVSKTEPQVRLGKASLVKDNKTIGRAEALDNGFDEFWNNYPKKVGKDKAKTEWNKKKPNIDDVLKALEWQKESEQWDKGFIPNPATYISQGRWKDEPIVKGAPF
ncbi:MAG TPA: replisome organizer [Psychromonas sp.]